MNPSYEDFVDQTFSKRYRQLELDIMRDIVRRIKKTSEITSSADWQIMRLTIMGNSAEEIRNMIKEAGELSENDMQKLFDDVVEKEYTRSADLYKEVGANFVPYEQNTEMQQLTQALITQSNNELKSITGTMGFMLDYGDGQGLRFTPHTEIFSDYLNNAVMGVASGAFDYNTMIRKVVTQMTNSGLRTVDYASGRHDRVDVAARRAVLTGLSQLTGRITDTNAAALNTDHFEVAWHAGARPTHQVWQGRVWSKKELVEVCGLGSVTGLLGANCYHDYYPFIPGVSERMYSDEWLDQMNREENTPKIFKGKEYTAYEARQHQRYIERCMRAQREKVELLKEGGADKDEVMLARCKYQAQLDEYKRFSKVMKLPEQRERIYYDMKGRVAPPRDVYQQYLAEQAEKRRRIQTEADKHKERAEEARRADIERNLSSGGNNDKIKSEGISMIDSRKHPTGIPAGVAISGDPINARQQRVLNHLKAYDDRFEFNKRDVSMKDLAALTAHEGVEFAMFTKGGKRLVIRGEQNSVNVKPEHAKNLASQGYRWSGHTHPGSDYYTIVPSPGDRGVLEMMNHKHSAIYSSTGRKYIFAVRAEDDIGRKD